MFMAAVFVAVALAGCAPEPAPTPSGFTDEDAAFAAAEATYRAYVDALNRVDLSDPETFEDVYRWTTGDLNASDRKGLSTYHAKRFTVTGQAIVASADRRDINPEQSSIGLDVCLDVSGVRLTDAAGESQVAPDRVDIQRLRIELESASRENMLISAITGREDGPEC